MSDQTMTLTGNLVDDPELHFTPSGQPVANFRVASTPRYKDSQTGEWKDGESLFLTCVAWRQMAENIAESLTRGTRVIVTGKLRQRSYETKEGEKRTVYELQVDEVGASLRNATAKVTRANRASQGGNGTQDQGDPWAGEGKGASYTDEPPF
jgi:single-strand DNA-binding protein